MLLFSERTNNKLKYTVAIFNVGSRVKIKTVNKKVKIHIESY